MTQVHDLGPPASPRNDDFLRELNHDLDEEGLRLGVAVETLDLYFLVYLRKLSRFGFFTLGPLTIDVRVVEDIVERTVVRGSGGQQPSWSDDLVRFSQALMAEVRRSGRQRIDEGHFLLAFMRTHEGLPERVFGELGVTPEEIDVYLRAGARGPSAAEKLYSPEEAATYLGVHVQTVRAWIRSGRLPARRLAGQRALRMTASDLQSVLEPLTPKDV